MNQLSIHQINKKEDQHFDLFWKIYSKSFPLCERRTFEQQIEVFKKIGYQLNGYVYENKLIGLLCFWTAKQFVFVEHFAVIEEARSHGFGSTILKAFSLHITVPVILEIELPIDDSTFRRLKFYESAGFVQNVHIHHQPPYHHSDQPIRLDILTYRYPISSELYREFSEFQINAMTGK
jgi:GNAT superfamily N-acetyltransferase